MIEELSKIATGKADAKKVADANKNAAKKPVKDAKALQASVLELVKDNSVVDILKAIVNTSTVDKLVKDTVLDSLNKVPDAISDYDDQIAFEEGAFLTEDGSYPTVEQARLALAQKAEAKEPVQLSESLSWNPETNVFTKTVVDEAAGSSEVIEYQTIEAALGLEVLEPLTDDQKAAAEQKKADALKKKSDALAAMKKKILDTATTEEAVTVAKEALTDVPAEEVLQGVIEVLAEVIDKVAEEQTQPTI